MHRTRLRTLAVAATTAAVLLLAAGGTAAVQAEYHDNKRPAKTSNLAEYHDNKRRP